MKASQIQQLVCGILQQLDGPGFLKLQAGQIVSVLLKEVRANAALVSFMGRDFTAVLKSEAAPGTRLRCLVEGERDGQLVLRVLNGGDEGVGVKTLESLLNDYGLKQTQTNLALLRQIIRHEMPLDSSTLKLLSAFASKAGVQENNAGIPVLMLSRGIPLEVNTYENIKQLLTDLNFMQGSLDKLTNSLRSLVSINNDDQGIYRLAVALSQKLNSLQVNSGSAPVDAIRLEQIFKMQTPNTLEAFQGHSDADQSPDADNQSAIAAKRTADQQPRSQLPNPMAGAADYRMEGARQIAVPNGRNEPVSPGDSRPAQGVVDTAALKEVPDFASFINRLSDNTQGDVIRSIVQRFMEIAGSNPSGPTDPTGSKLLGKLIHVLSPEAAGEAAREAAPESLTWLLKRFAAVLTEAGKPQYEEMVLLSRNLAGRLEQIQNFNRPENGTDPFYILYSSVRLEDRDEPLRIIISHRNGKNRQRDFSSCRVELTLNAPRIGLVKCEVQVRNRDLTLQFYVSDQLAAELIESSREDLIQRLAELKFNVAILRSKTLEAVEEAPLLETEEASRLFRVNLRA